MYFNKDADLDSPTEALSKKETQAQGFSYEFCKIFKNIFLCRTAPCFCNFNIAKVRLSMYCALLTNFRYLSKSLPNSINLVSLESDCQVEDHFLLFL